MTQVGKRAALSGRLIKSDTLVIAAKSVVYCELGDGAALLDTRSGTYFGLNEVGLHLWSLVQEPCRVDRLVMSVLNHYDVEEQRAFEDIKQILARLADAGLIQISSDQTA